MSPNTGTVVETYVDWIGASKSHDALLQRAAEESDRTPCGKFNWLMKSMENDVLRFGRLANFDHLCMLSKLGLAEIEAPSPYLAKATGPKKGARLLFDNDHYSKTKVKELDENVVLLGNHLGVSMQVMEDSICNWQKSPSNYLPFNG